MVKDELLKQNFYIQGQGRLSEYNNSLKKLGYKIDETTIKSLSLKAKNLDLDTTQEKVCKIILDTLRFKIEYNDKIIKWLKEYKKPSIEDGIYITKTIFELEKENSNNRAFYKKLNDSYSGFLKDVYSNENILDEIIDNENSNFEDDIKNDISQNLDQQITIGDTFGNINFENLISNAKNSALENWYKFLQDLHESPIKSFVLNKNTICNFKLIFKNPYTGLTTDKESVVHLSHSTSSKKTPVFSIGSVSYKATSTGVKLLAGSLVTAALDNVPLPYLHAISYMNHSSVEDLPPLDLYIIPIENISEEGRYEVLLIKGIQFVDMKQNDNASSTGIYYAFNYFAEDIVPLDFSESEKYFKIQYEGNNNL